MKRILCILLLLCLPFLGVAQQPIPYKSASPGYRYIFPRDHGAHPEFKIEWWYFTGQVQSSDGREFGYELTFFRNGVDRAFDNPSVWRIRDLYPAHFALTDITRKQFRYFEKINRAGPGIAGTETGTLNAWNENWSARLEGEQIRLKAKASEAEIDLTLKLTKSPVVHGRDGISRKADGIGHSSHYYSMTRLQTIGTVRTGNDTFEVRGESWMDHEFGTNQLAEDQAGWDWFGLHLDNGTDLMLYRMRKRDGSVDRNSSGTIVEADSRSRHLPYGEFNLVPTRSWKSTDTGTTYPIEWNITIAAEGISLRVVPKLDAQELITTRSTGIAYWEGAVEVTGIWRGQPVKGRGYMELTGHSAEHRPGV